jgi:hypothetical protein
MIKKKKIGVSRTFYSAVLPFRDISHMTDIALNRVDFQYDKLYT